MAGCSRALSEGHGTEPMKLSISGAGTFPTWRTCLMMSVHRGEAEIICSFRVFRILTHVGPSLQPAG